MPFNIKTDDDPDHYATFVESLMVRASSAMQNADNDIAMRSAIHAFLEEGYTAGLTSEELTDFFCVDTPSVVDRAELAWARADEAVAMFDQINDQLLRDRPAH
jgi:hypothetical protein